MTQSDVHRLDADAPLPIMRLRGEIDLNTARALNEPIADLVGSGAPTVALDVSEVTFMDSTALGAVVRMHQRLARQSRVLVIVCPEGPVRRLLELSGLLPALNVVASEDRIAGAGSGPS